MHAPQSQSRSVAQFRFTQPCASPPFAVQSKFSAQAKRGQGTGAQPCGSALASVGLHS
jgi:hypothetical protein